MKLSEAYRTIPYDLSGSMSKNRFRQEILWGLSKCLIYLRLLFLFEKSLLENRAFGLKLIEKVRGKF